MSETAQRREVETLLAAVNRGEESVVVQRVRLPDGSHAYHLRPVVRRAEAAPVKKTRPPVPTPPPKVRVPRAVWWLIGVTALAVLLAVAWLIWVLAHVVAANASLIGGGLVLAVIALALVGRGCHIVIQHWH